jgi:hypothetical protein
MKYRRLTDNFKKKSGISDLEKELIGYNSKSCNIFNFKKYIIKKNEVNEKLLKKYEDGIFRKYKWYGFINRKRAETDLVKLIKNTFGKTIKLIYGDWSAKHQMRHMMSTPNLGLKRKIGEYFRIYNIDEFRTSCLNNKTLGRCENLYLPDKKKTMRKIHSILTYKMENKRKGCINRDDNAVKNMISITDQYLKDRTRPEHFRRGVDLEELEERLKKTTEGYNLKFAFNTIRIVY